MKTKLFLIGLLSLLAASCSLNEIVEFEDEFVLGADEFYVTIDEQPGSDTKVYADENLKVLWNEDDRFTFFNMNDHNQEYIFLGDDGDNSGRVIPVGTVVTGDPLEHIYAVYPYAESTSIDASGKISFTLPSEQSYHEKSFGIGANTMVSVTDENKIRFKNVGGYLSLKFYGEGVSVSSIVLKSNGGELLSGPCTIETSSGLPVVKMDSGSASDQITIVCETPVALGATSSEAVQFIFVLPPVTLSEGFTVKVTTPDGAVFEKSSDRKREIARSAITPLGAMAVYPELPGNISFADQTVKSICVKYWDDNEDGGLSYEEAASVESLMVDASLTKAGDEVSAFAGTGITTFDELVYFTGLIEIEEGAFENCKGLKSVTISEQVGRIGDNAFNGCKNLESITLTSTTPPEIGEGVFDNTNNCPIYVPEEAVEAYLSEWSEYTEYVERIAGAILPEAFPDENFRAYVFKNFDINKDDLLSEEECEEVTEINVNTENICSLQGIEYFPNLQSLICSPNDDGVKGSLEYLDVTNNLALTYLDCLNNKLTALDVSHNTALTTLNCHFNQIESLDVSNNTALTTLNCHVNQIGSLDVSNNTELTLLDCHMNQIESLDVTNNTKLWMLGCHYNKLESLDVSANTLLRYLFCSDNLLGSLDVSNNTVLMTLDCTRNPMTTLYLASGQTIRSLQKPTDTEIVYKDAGPAADEIWYKTSDGEAVTYTVTTDIGNIIDESQCKAPKDNNGIGVIRFTRTLTNIDNNALKEQVNLTSVSLPDSVVRIGASAFEYCSNLSEVHLGASLEIIGKWAFGSTNLGDIDFLPEGLREIGPGAFESCHAKTVVIPESVESIGLTDYDFPMGNPFSVCSELETFVGKFATEDGKALIETAPDGKTYLISYAIGNKDDSYVVPEVDAITYFAFWCCSNLKRIELPSSLKTIYDCAFDSCSSLESITIPYGVQAICGSAFSLCKNLGWVIIEAPTVPSTQMSRVYCQGRMFSSSTCDILVPASIVEAYKAANYWSDYADRIKPLASIPEAVDLGLSVKWASFNLGATAPEESGDYYAWGETQPNYSSLDPLTWKPGKNRGYYWTGYFDVPSGGYDGTFVKYEFGKKTTLDPEDDAAHVNLGGTFRIPTVVEWAELRTNCTWEWKTTEDEGYVTNGYLVTGLNGNTVFLPFTGCWGDTQFDDSSSDYWSSSLCSSEGYSYDAQYVSLYPDRVSGGNSLRCFGNSIRPVCTK